MAAERGLRLVADVGGTSLRIGLADTADGRVRLLAIEELATASISSVAEALASYWRRQGAPRLAAIAVCVAGPVDGAGLAAVATLTNVQLTVSAQSLSHALGAPAVRLVNDFAAVAAATPALQGADLDPHGESELIRDAVTVVLGPGTGLGVAAWLPGGGVVAGEGGHARLAAPDAEAAPIWDQLAKVAPEGFVAAEQVLCGRGLVALHQAAGRLHGLPADLPDGAAVWQASHRGDALAQEAVGLFTRALGAYAGDLALIFGARNLLLAGGILPRWGQTFDHRLFRQSLAAKEPAFRVRLQGLPTATIVHTHPGLLGLGCLPLWRLPIRTRSR